LMWLNSNDYTLYVKEIYNKEKKLIDKLNLKSAK